MNNNHRIYSVSVASVYPHYVAKAEKKGRTKSKVDTIIRWLTGHGQETLEKELAKKTNFEDFFAQAPQINPSRSPISGVICGGVRAGYRGKHDARNPLSRQTRRRTRQGKSDRKNLAPVARPIVRTSARLTSRARRAKRTLPGELSGAVGHFTIEANMVLRPANSARANETWREEDQSRSSKSEIDAPAVFIHGVIDHMFAA